MFQISRWKCPLILSILTLSVLVLSAALTSQAIAADKTLTAVMHSDLRVIDPGFTPAYITRDHGYMVYDTLLATDSNLVFSHKWRTGKSPATSSFTLSRYATD
jgi:peptide/nickel transport system substrate-binding protein